MYSSSWARKGLCMYFTVLWRSCLSSLHTKVDKEDFLLSAKVCVHMTLLCGLCGPSLLLHAAPEEGSRLLTDRWGEGACTSQRLTSAYISPSTQQEVFVVWLQASFQRICTLWLPRPLCTGQGWLTATQVAPMAAQVMADGWPCRLSYGRTGRLPHVAAWPHRPPCPSPHHAGHHVEGACVSGLEQRPGCANLMLRPVRSWLHRSTCHPLSISWKRLCVRPCCMATHANINCHLSPPSAWRSAWRSPIPTLCAGHLAAHHHAGPWGDVHVHPEDELDCGPGPGGGHHRQHQLHRARQGCPDGPGASQWFDQVAPLGRSAAVPSHNRAQVPFHNGPTRCLNRPGVIPMV